MSEILSVILALIAGLGLGTLFFGGLWITVQRALKSTMPGLWFSGGLISRLTITMLGFYFVGKDNWHRLFACTVGFIVARYIVLYVTKRIEEKRNQIRKEVVNET